jgi:predicted ArsR family transcriptional regulator
MHDLRRSVELTDPRALRAVAHPVRLALVGLLRREGPLTATQAGARLEESPSFHLRQLAKHGLVEDAGGGRGRERPWRATALFTRWGETRGDPEVDAASELFTAVVAEHYFERVREWLARRPQEPAAWQEAAPFGDELVFVTAAELAELSAAVSELCDRYLERTTTPELRPPGARPVSILKLAYPLRPE